MAFAEDLSAFLADFGEEATLSGAAVRVIFDAPGGADLGITHAQPQVQIRSADVPADYGGATLVRGSQTYAVREHIADGTGMSLLLLDNA